jgi:hypothetical protein
MPSPENCRQIEGPSGPGVYQVRNDKTNQFVLFGISNNCRNRMKSFFPPPYGTGKRNNEDKRKYVFRNWQNLQYRTYETTTRDEAKNIEDRLKAQGNHIFNT